MSLDNPTHFILNQEVKGQGHKSQNSAGVGHCSALSWVMASSRYYCYY